MLSTLIQIKECLVKLLEWILILLVAVLVLDVLWQVFSRFVLNDPSSWTDELATLLIIWVAMIGASVAFIRNNHLGVDYFVGKLKPRPRLISEIVVQCLVCAFALMVLTIGGIKLVTLTLLTEQVSPALMIKMGYVYMALPISGIVIALTSIETAIEKMSALNGMKEEVSE